jgi:hypothetical protein
MLQCSSKPYPSKPSFFAYGQHIPTDQYRYLAPLHGLDYVTPSIVALAAKKIYPHRIHIAPPERERSMQYGSDLNAAQELLEGVTPETVIEAVLNSVECPL